MRTVLKIGKTKIGQVNTAHSRDAEKETESRQSEDQVLCPNAITHQPATLDNQPFLLLHESIKDWPDQILSP